MASKSPKSLAETKDWFRKAIIPKRTASAGFSANRLWKGPRAVVQGNTEDPDGLCGDTAAYVIQEFWNEYGDYTTSDGYQIGLILWNGKILNHIANVMLLKGKVGPETYKWDGRKQVATLTNGKPGSYSPAALTTLNVYDLYYKKLTTVHLWWRGLDSDMTGTVKIAQLHTIDD